MEQFIDRVRVTLIVSGIGNLSMTILWAGVALLLTKTNLDLLKLLAIMISAMNLIWFVGVLFFYLGSVSDNRQT